MLASANFGLTPRLTRDSMKQSGLRLLILGLAFGLLGGCSSISYYYQAASGQWELWRKSEPIADVLAREPNESELARRLRLVQAIRLYAEQELHLPVGNSYSAYTDLERPYVVWNLFAAPELSLQPKQWCYPLLGCLNYRGYFDPQPALTDARTLEADGWETYVGGTIAYSTLGWFDDPVLNTFWQLDDAHLAALLFHELAHQVAFATGDTRFNESFATAVELHGIEGWLRRHYGESQAHRLQRQFSQRQQIIALVGEYTDKLRSLYGSPLSDTGKRAQKQVLFDQLRQRYGEIRAHWEEDIGFDGWFNTPLNNAKILTLTSYFDLVPTFLAKIDILEGDLPAFYRWVQALADLPQAERDRLLAEIEPRDLSLPARLATDDKPPAP